MDYNLAHFADRLREARIAKNVSQRELSKLAGVPQSHISKIESNQVDLRLSSLIALANALDLEVALIPRKAMPAVQSLSRQAVQGAASRVATTEEMRNLQDTLRTLQTTLPARPELDAIRKAYSALKSLPLDNSALRHIRQITQTLGRDTEQWAAITAAAQKMTLLRNRLAQSSATHHTLAEAQPAYSLDEDDD
ncbi:helix-turn-helix domain-containing protein [Paenalcaligenes sp. Me131]|uniref:helix-turn-helix domain-containing protein n=1 Tax=Paenalcaligenes sp. Me131 TaxID=3392636 RepID=UPI003D27C17D